jgi:predicted phosphodiesterase
MKRVLVLPDTQVPFHDRPAIKAALAYASQHKWHEVVVLGDFMDFDQISSYNRGQPRKTGRRLAADYAEGNALLSAIEESCSQNGGKPKFVLLEGNHDFRIEKYLDEHPEAEGMLEVEEALGLKSRGWKYVRCYAKGDTYKIGKCSFHHGLYTTNHHSKKHVEAFETNLVYGHCHDVQLTSKVNFGSGKTKMAASLGCLCSYEQEYMGKKPSNWQHAIGTMFFQKNGNFDLYISRIFDGVFTGPDGVEYSHRSYSGGKF